MKKILIISSALLIIPMNASAALHIDEKAESVGLGDTALRQSPLAITVIRSASAQSGQTATTTDGSTDASLWEGDMITIPPETASWFHDVWDLFTQAAVVLIDLIRHVIEDIKTAFQTAHVP